MVASKGERWVERKGEAHVVGCGLPLVVVVVVVAMLSFTARVKRKGGGCSSAVSGVAGRRSVRVGLRRKSGKGTFGDELVQQATLLASGGARMAQMEAPGPPPG
jgi:hypothetical protein